MSKIRKILLVCLIVVCLALSAVGIAACSVHSNWREPAGGVQDDGSRDPNNQDGDLPFYYPEGFEPGDDVLDDNSYVIRTISVGGLPLSNIRVTVSKNGQTVVEGISQNGGLKFGGIAFDNYELSYDNLPLGYSEDERGTVYNLTPETHTVTTRFNSSVITANMPSGWMYSLGDVMYNFRYMNALGQEVVLSELLQTKRVVILNFWATWCSPCVSEFPALNRAYMQYKDDVEVVALSIESNDTNTVIENFRNSFSVPLEFFMAYDSLGLESNMAINDTVPTTIIIDRYGVITQRHVGSITSDLDWIDIFKKYTAENYSQDLVTDTGGDTENTDPVAVPDFLKFDPISDNAFNQALLGEGMDPLHYYGPEDGTSDAIHNWPYRVEENAEDGMYLAATNVGTYYNPSTGDPFATNNTWAILYTDLKLETDETLSIEVKLNTESSYDNLYIIINNSAVHTSTISGKTEGWQEITLYSATRPTNAKVAIAYYKDQSGSPEDEEYVRLRNLKITSVDLNSHEPLDLRTELSTEMDDGSYTYKDVYLADDGFYHVVEGITANPETDSILFLDIMYETLWTDRHLSSDYVIRTEDGSNLIPSLYNLSFFVLGGGDANFGYSGYEAILDCFYVQDGELDELSPVTEEVRQALDSFARYVHTNSSRLLGNAYIGNYTDNTWLELCTYYRTHIGHNPDTDNMKGHVCKAHTNPGSGKILRYALPLNEGVTLVDTSVGASVNFMYGVLYKMEAFNGAGVYRIKSTLGATTADRVDPYILVWASDQNAYSGNPLAEQDDAVSLERYTNNTTDFEVYLYLQAGQYVYPQFTTRAVDSPGEYEVVVEYLGEGYHLFRTASTADGMWVGTGVNDAVYGAISTTLGGPNNDTYYHLLSNGETGSVVYIDFIHSNYFANYGVTLKEMIDRGAFNIQGVGNAYTQLMNKYYEKAIEGKDPSDETYGMTEATYELVRVLCDYIAATTGEAMSTGYWKAFAFYYQYYGSSAWEPLPVE